jgi:hypothetical protein
MDSQTITLMATTAVGLLIPYFAKAGEAAAKNVGEDIYQALKKGFKKKPLAQEALDDLEKSPEDSDLQAVLRVQLKKTIEEDKAFAMQLKQLLQEAQKTETGATIIKQVAGDNAKQFGQVFGDVTFGKD